MERIEGAIDAAITLGLEHGRIAREAMSSRAQLKALGLVYASQRALGALENCQGPEATEAAEELQRTLDMIRYELSAFQLSPTQVAFLRDLAARCPSPKCKGECVGGWLRQFAGRDRSTAMALAAAGLVTAAEGQWFAVHVTPLGRTFAAASPTPSRPPRLPDVSMADFDEVAWKAWVRSLKSGDRVLVAHWPSGSSITVSTIRITPTGRVHVLGQYGFERANWGSGSVRSASYGTTGHRFIVPVPRGF